MRYAILLLLAAQTAMAQSRLFVPVAGNTPGAYGTDFRTDLTVHNGLDVPQDVALVFLATGRDNFLADPLPPAVTKTIGPNETITFQDIVNDEFQAFGIGAIQIIALRDGFLDDNARLAAAYRIYTTLPAGPGTMSQASSAIDFSHAYDTRPSSVALATGLRQDADFRTNVGVFNGDPYHSRSFRVTATGERGSTSVAFSVWPYSMTQVPLPEGDFGRMSIQFERLDDSQDSDYPLPFVGFGSSVDNRTGDSWLASALPFSTADHHPATSLILPAGDVDGANGTHFQTDLDITNHSDVDATVRISLYAGIFAYGDPASDTSLTIPALSTQTFSNVTAGLLLSPGQLGSIIINTLDDGVGYDPEKLSATYRIWTPSPETGEGSLSYASEAVDLQTLPRGDLARLVIGVRLDRDFRCNVGIANDGYYPQSFRITASSPAGSVTTTATAEGFHLTQIPLPSADLGYVTITITPLGPVYSDRWTAYATSVDNVTGDSWLQNAFISR